MKRRVAVAGVAERIGRLPDRDVFTLFADLLIEAVLDAGIGKADIDGIIATQSLVNRSSRLATSLAEYVGLRNLKWADSVNLGAQSHGTMVSRAANAIRAGLAETIVVGSVDFQLSGLTTDNAVKAMADVRHAEYEQPYGLFMPAIMALKARRYLHQHRLDEDVFSPVAVCMRAHAALKKENVMYRDPIAVDDVRKSKMIAEPLRLLDCAPIVDGGAVIILTTGDRARDLKKAPVYHVRTGENYSHECMIQDNSLTETPIRLSVARAFEGIDVSRKDIDVLFVHDAFTPVVLFALEEFGVCEEGGGGEFVRAGNIRVGGTIPVNTHGGLLSQGHPGIPGGLPHIVEAVRQLRGECGERQVKNARHAATVHFGGPLSMASTTVWSAR